MEVWKSGLGMDGSMEVWIRDVWMSGLGMDGCMYVCLDISQD